MYLDAVVSAFLVLTHLIHIVIPLRSFSLYLHPKDEGAKAERGQGVCHSCSESE